MQSPALSFSVRAAQTLASLPTPERQTLWLADRLAQGAAAAVVKATGFAALDAELPGGGWPATGLTELLIEAPGSGELRLLAPLLAGSRAGSVLCVAPPFMPYAPALYALRLSLEGLLLVRPETLADAAWAAEQGLRSGACAAVLWWQGQARAPAAALATALRRLHLAAGNCPLFAFRPTTARAQSSPAPLRLVLEPTAQTQLTVTVFKRRGPVMAAPLSLTLPIASVPASRALRRVSIPAASPLPLEVLSLSESADAVVRAAPERIAA